MDDLWMISGYPGTPISMATSICQGIPRPHLPRFGGNAAVATRRSAQLRESRAPRAVPSVGRKSPGAVGGG